MSQDERFGVWLPLGALGAVALGVALIPLRTLTTASNLAFVFLAWTIVVAEAGGRIPALVTALAGAMSLNFFLTEPYLTLTIDKTDDLIAFVALGGCGLIAAAFGTRRARGWETAARNAAERDVLRRLVIQVRRDAPLEAMLADLREVFGLRALALRDEAGHLLAATPSGAVGDLNPATELSPDTHLALRGDHHHFGARGLRLPPGGGRLSLDTGRGMARLELWEGDARGFDVEQWRTLSLAAEILGLRLAAAREA